MKRFAVIQWKNGKGSNGHLLTFTVVCDYAELTRETDVKVIQSNLSFSRAQEIADNLNWMDDSHSSDSRRYWEIKAEVSKLNRAKLLEELGVNTRMGDYHNRLRKAQLVKLVAQNRRNREKKHAGL